MPNTYLVVIPLYNHAATIAATVRSVMQELGRDAALLVVNDGSTDNGAAQLSSLKAEFADGAFNFISHERNLGKGAALQSAAAWAMQHGFSHVITLDADGQHSPQDIASLRTVSEQKPNALVVGERKFTGPHVPASSRFGRAFSGFWMRVQTGVAAPDMQSGFRVYPAVILQGIKCCEKRFAFEMEILVRSAWAGFEIVSVPVSVYYPPPEERVSHFDKWRDNLLITFMNTRLVIRALVPVPFSQKERDIEGKITVLHPLRSLSRLLKAEETPLNLAVSTAVTVMVNAIPILGFQSILLLLLIGYLRLNRVWSLVLHYALFPPLLIPIFLEAGYFIRHGALLTEFSWTTLGQEAHVRVMEWAMGVICFAPLLGFGLGLVVFIAARQLGRGLNAAPDAGN